MKSILAICVLVLGSGVLGLGQTPPLPDDRAGSPLRAEVAGSAVPALPYTGLIEMRVVKCTPQISRVEFYCRTNRPLRWRLESSTDLLTWRLCEQYTGTNDFSPRVPMLRDNAQLVTWLLVQPAQERAYYRLKPLP